MEAALNFLDLTITDAQMILLYSVIFAVFWLGMAKLFWGPYLKLYEQREALTEGAESTAQAQNQEAAKLREEFDNKLSSARVEAMQDKLSKIGEAASKASVMISSAEQKASEEIASARAELQKNLDAVKQEAFSQTDSMVEDVVESLKKPLSETRSTIQ